VSTVGYSGRPLADKLGIKAGEIVYAVDAPEHYRELLGQLPAGARVLHERPAEPVAFIHLFVRTREELAELGPQMVGKLAPGGTLWLSWPKKSSKLFRDVTEDSLREVLLPTGVVDVKVCAVDEDWSGLKFLWRKK
jgi:hypothetical protein